MVLHSGYLKTRKWLVVTQISVEMTPTYGTSLRLFENTEVVSGHPTDNNTIFVYRCTSGDELVSRRCFPVGKHHMQIYHNMSENTVRHVLKLAFMTRNLIMLQLSRVLVSTRHPARCITIQAARRKQRSTKTLVNCRVNLDTN